MAAGLSAPQTQDAAIGQTGPAEFGAPKRFKTESILGMVVLGLAVAWIIWSFASGPTLFLQVLTIGLSNGALYALIALGYTMVYGIIELINFAHGDLFMLGSVVGAIFLEQWIGQKSSSAVAWFWLGVTLLFSMAACALFNVIIERLAYRRLRNAPKLAPLITAVGVSFILQNIGIKLNGSAPHSRFSVLPKTAITVGSVDIRIKYIVVVCITIPLLLLMTWIVQKTRTGKAMRATAQDRDASLLMGINVDKIISFTFALGGALAGAAGVMFVQVNEQTRYDAGFRLGLIAFTAAVLGGVGNLLGAVVGGVLIGVIQSLNDGAPHFFGQKWTQTVMFSILIVMVIFRPGGIFGASQQEKV
ncbi:MAG: branched-chain amino acid transport system permease protein [Ilumatobacteraceae bacterium]|nr:branched-chain amino acid transport system permease protein [Ilumatobacteraceae bacterium]